MWVWVTVLGLLVEVGVIVALGRAATRGSEQDSPSGAVGPVPVAPSVISRPVHPAGPAARR